MTLSVNKFAFEVWGNNEENARFYLSKSGFSISHVIVFAEWVLFFNRAAY